MATGISSSARIRAFHSSTARIGILLLLAVGIPSAQQARQAKSKAKDAPLTAEQLAVYQVVLHDWIDDGKAPVNLAMQTVPFASTGAFDATACGKGLDLEPLAPGVSHRFRTLDLPHLGTATIALADPLRQAKDVDANDPEKSIVKGMQIEDAVENGYAHGMVTLSEIRFDKAHRHAVVSYGFRCGALCGNGGAAQLEKVDGVWKRKSLCSDWVS
jgi:hypothetical protein